jgi:signal transduction histidine kinase
MPADSDDSPGAANTNECHDLAAANARLQELDRLKDQFVSNVSHELRTPLTNIKLYVNLLAHGRADRHAHYIEVIARESDRLERLIDDLLDLSRLDIARVRGAPEPVAVDMVEVVDAIVASHAPRAKAATVALAFAPDGTIPPVRGDRNQIAQIVANLVANAVSYTLPGGRVSIALRPAGQSVRLSVTDTGIGIAPEDLPHVFDRFYRGTHDRVRAVPGTGLGLAIVKEIVGLHGGSVNLSSAADGGTRIDVDLPIWEVPS